MAQRPEPSRRSDCDFAITTSTASEESPSPPYHPTENNGTPPAARATSTIMGKNKNRRRAQGQKKTAEQQKHNRNASSASSSTALGGSTAPSTPVQRVPFSERQNHSDSGGEEEAEKGKEVTAEGVGEEKDGGDRDKKPIDGQLLQIRPAGMPPLPVRRRPITRQRLLVGGLWTAAFLSLMAQMMFEPKSKLEWREALRGTCFSLAAIGLSMSVLYMRGMDIQFSHILE